MESSMISHTQLINWNRRMTPDQVGWKNVGRCSMLCEEGTVSNNKFINFLMKWSSVLAFKGSRDTRVVSYPLSCRSENLNEVILKASVHTRPANVGRTPRMKQAEKSWRTQKKGGEKYLSSMHCKCHIILGLGGKGVFRWDGWEKVGGSVSLKRRVREGCCFLSKYIYFFLF